MAEYSYKEVIETATRMHNKYVLRCQCGDCPLGNSNIAHCRKIAFEDPEAFSKIVMDWGASHKAEEYELTPSQMKQLEALKKAGLDFDLYFRFLSNLR